MREEVRLLRRLMKEERGNVLFLGAISLMTILCMAGLAIDGSLAYMKKTALQKAANAAVLSGAQELTTTEQKVTNEVQYILNSHKETNSFASVDITMGKGLRVRLSKQVNLAFSRVFGFDKVQITAEAAAGLAPIGKSAGAAPLGIDESIPLEYYKAYELKVDTTGVIAGTFGVLALNRPGAKTYEENLRYGYQDELKIGEIVETQTGNIAGGTRDGVNLRVNGCTQPPGDYSMRNCSRILLVPVYKPYSYDSNQLKSVKITGFAYFYITDPMSSTDTSIKGVFIKRTGPGSFEEGSVERGAYSIRLTE
jgi:hypothetical protein